MTRFLITETVTYYVEAETEEEAIQTFLKDPNQFISGVEDRHVVEVDEELRWVNVS